MEAQPLVAVQDASPLTAKHSLCGPGNHLILGSSLPRGTKAFTILLSNDGSTWAEALRGVLDNVAHRQCDVPVEDFYLGGERTERYVRLVLNSYYGVGAGMQWINFEQQGDPGDGACECKNCWLLAAFKPALPSLLQALLPLSRTATLLTLPTLPPLQS